MKTTIFVLGLVFAVTTATPLGLRKNTQNVYKMCVPEEILSDCNQMAEEQTKSTAKIICIAARDRMECLDKIKNREADFLTVDPEDMYVGKNIDDQDFSVFEEIRTKEEPEAEFRYEAVAVIHKDLEIKDLQGLKGLKSCHTGIGRNVGYKIPLTKLRKMGLIGGLNDTDISPRENELKALSTFFSKACIVGKWSADPNINRKLKNKYSNLCQLCENPDVCDYPDKFSGYEGALKCLSHNGGQVAWTKVIFVRKFFGLPVGTTPASKTEEDPDQFAYLCPDGTKLPVTENNPCRWAARPWQGFMANADVIKTVDELRAKLENLDTVGEKSHAHWFESVLDLNNKTVIKPNKPISPQDYLDKANYTDVIEREYGPPVKTVRLCVTSDVALDKCRTLSKAAFSRDLRPRFDCVQQSNIYDCLKAIQGDAADIISLDASQLEAEKSAYNLKPILTEEYGSIKGAYSVAVVKKNSAFQNLEELKGKTSCHPEINNIAGYNAPLYALIKQGLIKKTDCPLAKALSQFFSGGSCVPGAKQQEIGIQSGVADKLCSQCVGSKDNKSERDSHKCSASNSENYYGYSGAFRCLAEGHGDVAFVKHFTVQQNTDQKNKNDWALNLNSADYELLCPKGGRKPIDKYEECYLAKIPANMVVTSNAKSDGDIDQIRHLLVSTSELFSKRDDLFKLFGTFKGYQDVLFKDATTALVSYDQEAQKTYNKILKDTTCSE